MNIIEEFIFTQYIQTVVGSKKSECLRKVKHFLCSRADEPVQATIILRDIPIQIKYPEFSDINLLLFLQEQRVLLT